MTLLALTACDGDSADSRQSSDEPDEGLAFTESLLGVASSEA